MKPRSLSLTSTRALSASFAGLVLALGLVGCASGESSVPSQSTGAAPRHSGNAGAGMDPNMDMGSTSHGPSETAAMVCSDEIAGSVEKIFRLPTRPQPTDTWSDHIYTCTYALPLGTLTLSVQDSPDKTSGMAYFAQLRRSLQTEVGVHPISGLSGLGLPSYESDNGHVVFIKDGKTLHVDASTISTSALHGASRTDTAYQLATDVIACWSE